MVRFHLKKSPKLGENSSNLFRSLLAIKGGTIERCNIIVSILMVTLSNSLVLRLRVSMLRNSRFRPKPLVDANEEIRFYLRALHAKPSFPT